MGKSRKVLDRHRHALVPRHQAPLAFSMRITGVKMTNMMRNLIWKLHTKSIWLDMQTSEENLFKIFRNFHSLISFLGFCFEFECCTTSSTKSLAIMCNKFKTEFQSGSVKCSLHVPFFYSSYTFYIIFKNSSRHLMLINIPFHQNHF